ncbi:ABC transporter permease subunit [Sneathiella sp. P13V-1]|uniref:ABC transporter permease subunit n=1 Tax=Sneathiella sp. P13V-1 TaxID=2697366 RepID=UPI00187BBC94|nr:ABC transporter permease subunit [Sneathiella sp. P13V-1]MBE7635918.1 ABC transporter permease subunit [Sneathiella sp. P13V-1]
MTSLLTLTFKEIRDGYRNWWVGTAIVVMTALALVLSLLGSAPVGTTSISALTVTTVSLSSLSVFFIPLIALLLSYNSVVGEDERGTLLLLLTYPVPRSFIVLGKFIGQLVILTLAILIGYGVAAMTIVLTSSAGFADQNWLVFGKLIFSSIMLGAVFLGIGILVSSVLKESATAAAWAIGIWLIFVVLFDMALLGVLSSGASSYLPDAVVKWVMLANPADAYRMFNLATSDETALLSGMAGLRSDQIVSPTVMIGVLTTWVLLPICAFCLSFQGRRT